jgi:hypothetical protein
LSAPRRSTRPHLGHQVFDVTAPFSENQTSRLETEFFRLVFKCPRTETLFVMPISFSLQHEWIFLSGSPKSTPLGKSARGRSAEGGSKEACHDWRLSVVADAPSKPTVDAEHGRHPFRTRPARAKLTRLHRLNRPRRCQAIRKTKPASDQPWQWSIAKERPSRGRAVCRRPSPKRPSPPRQPVPAPPRS